MAGRGKSESRVPGLIVQIGSPEHVVLTVGQENEKPDGVRVRIGGAFREWLTGRKHAPAPGNAFGYDRYAACDHAVDRGRNRALDVGEGLDRARGAAMVGSRRRIAGQGWNSRADILWPVPLLLRRGAAW